MNSRLFSGASLRRGLVYVLAGVMIIIAGIVAVQLARPTDPYRDLRSISPGGDPRSQITSAEWTQLPPPRDT